jgi:hypothetical protein
LLQEWRSDKHLEDIVPVSSRNPDLVFRMFTDATPKTFFAIECKWRAKTYDEGIDWASMGKRIIYNKFGTKLKMPIHVTFSLGGSPDQPEKCYLIPFEKIKYYDFIAQQLLNKYPWPNKLADLKAYMSHWR